MHKIVKRRSHKQFYIGSPNNWATSSLSRQPKPNHAVNQNFCTIPPRLYFWSKQKIPGFLNPTRILSLTLYKSTYRPENTLGAIQKHKNKKTWWRLSLANQVFFKLQPSQNASKINQDLQSTATIVWFKERESFPNTCHYFSRLEIHLQTWKHTRSYTKAQEQKNLMEALPSQPSVLQASTKPKMLPR